MIRARHTMVTVDIAFITIWSRRLMSHATSPKHPISIALLGLPGAKPADV